MGRRFNSNNLVFLEEGTILYKQTYGGVEVLGHSSKVETWITIWDNYDNFSGPTFLELINRVWDKVPTPMFDVVIRKNHYENKLEGIKRLGNATNIEGVQVAFEEVSLTTSNPFVLSAEDKDRVQAALTSYKEEKDAYEAIRKAHQDKVGLEMLEAVRAFTQSNTSFKLVEKEYEDGVHVHSSKVVVVANGVEVATINFMEFIKQVFPELREKYKSV